MIRATPESIKAAFDEVQRFAPSMPLFRWAEIDDIEPIEIKWPKPIVPDPIEWDCIETIGRNNLNKQHETTMQTH